MALPDLSKLDHNDEAAMAEQIYRLQNENPALNSIQVIYKGFVFNLNFEDGSVKQEIMKEGAVHSLVKPELAAEYAEQIKTALSLAADIKLLDYIKSIDDNAVQQALEKVMKSSHPNARAAYILAKLTVGVRGFGLFSQANDSMALRVVCEVLKDTDIYSMTNRRAVDTVCQEIDKKLVSETMQLKSSGH